MTDKSGMHHRMARDGKNARKRLRHSALELFAENGFEQTTAAQIAARAGVTERTFFRHFPDKREVLFDGQEILAATLSNAIAAVPQGASPIETLRQAFVSISDMLEANRPYSEPRQRIISGHPALREREAAKRTVLTKTVAEALRKRGFKSHLSTLAAQIGTAAFSNAFAQWLETSPSSLEGRLNATFSELQMLLSPSERD